MRGVGVRARTVGIAAAMAVLISACGDSGPEVGGSAAASIDESAAVEQIDAVTERFERALHDRDVAAFCRILAPSAVQRLGGGETNGKKECLVVWRPGRNPLFRPKAPDLAVESVSFEGAYATAKLANGGELGFSYEGGKWYVHLAPEPGQGAKR